MNKKLCYLVYVIAILWVFLNGCASTEMRFIVAPTITVENNSAASSVISSLAKPSSAIINNQTISLDVSDLRIKKHLVEIVYDDKATKLIYTERLLAGVINDSLTMPLAKQGMVIAKQSSNEITLAINKTNISVKQSLATYTADTVIELQVTVNNQIKTLTKSFQTVAQSNGLLSVDIAVLERDFNQELSALLSQIISDKDIQHFLQ
jgi:uncharacterized lipoprotein YajG